MSDKQELFNKVYTGLAKQEWKQSLSEGGECAYRGENGCKCAAGHLIPDEYYNISMEGTVFGRSGTFNLEQMTCGHYNAFQLLLKEIPELNDNISFIEKMQDIHDNYSDPDIMKNKLHFFGRANSLKIPE